MWKTVIKHGSKILNGLFVGQSLLGGVSSIRAGKRAKYESSLEALPRSENEQRLLMNRRQKYVQTGKK